MVVLGGINIALNLESANKTVWSICLGAGLALNIGSVLTQAWTPVASIDPATIDFHIDIPSGNEFSAESILKFPQVYWQYTVAGANYMMGPATKLLLVLTAIGAMIKLSLDLVSGDKVRYFAELILETGVYFFLITNWYGDTGLNIMGTLCAGFEELGQKAGGSGAFVITNNDVSRGMVSNDILGNSATIFLKSVENGVFSITSPIASIMTGLMLLVILILLILTGIEMFMARIEFWTLAMATIPLIPFAALPQTRFLFTSALNGMMNLAIKVSVIAFISTVSSKILTDYITEFAKIGKDQANGNFALYIQALLVSLLLYIIIKLIPDIVSSLLSGTPSLKGASMKQMATQAANTAVQAGAAVATGATSVAASGFKAAGTAAAGGAKFGGLGAGLNAAGGAMLTGGKDMMARALIGTKNANNSGGSGGGDMRSGGLLSGAYNAVQQGKQIGKAFNSAKEDGTFKTATGMTGVDKAMDFAKDVKQNGIGTAASNVVNSGFNKLTDAVSNNPYTTAKDAAKNPKPSAGSQTTTSTSTSSTTTSTPSRSNLANKVNQGYKPTGNNNTPKK